MTTPHPHRPSVRVAGRRAQRGATLVIGMIMLVLITLIVVSAFTLSSSNLKSVGNMQMRQESAAAASQTIETYISTSATPFYSALPTSTTTFQVDIDKDGTYDYNVALAVPVCFAAKQVSVAAPSDVELPVAMQSGADWDTDWDLDATVTDTHNSGATVRVREGVRIRLGQTAKTSACNQPSNRRTP